MTFYTNVAKELKLKVREFWPLILTFVEVTWEKLVRGYPPMLNRVKEKRASKARINQLHFQNVENNEVFEISNLLLQKQRLVVYWTVYFLFFFCSFVPVWSKKIKIVSLR